MHFVFKVTWHTMHVCNFKQAESKSKQTKVIGHDPRCRNNENSAVSESCFCLPPGLQPDKGYQGKLSLKIWKIVFRNSQNLWIAQVDPQNSKAVTVILWCMCLHRLVYTGMLKNFLVTFRVNEHQSSIYRYQSIILDRSNYPQSVSFLVLSAYGVVMFCHGHGRCSTLCHSTNSRGTSAHRGKSRFVPSFFIMLRYFP